MAGCGGCTPGQCNGPCSRREEAPRDRYTLTDALARVIVDNRVVKAAIDVSKRYPEYTAEDIVIIVNEMKSDGRLDEFYA